MSTIRKFCCNDLLRFASVNLDHLAVTSSIYLYMQWLIKWPNYSHVAVAPGNRIVGYIIGGVKEKEEGQDENYWHGLVMAVNVASEYRRQKLGTKLMRLFEKQMVEKMLSSQSDRPCFVHLYVRVSNTPAINFFEKLDYQYMGFRIERYYPDKEDAYEMISEALNEEREYFHFTTGEILTLRNWPLYN